MLLYIYKTPTTIKTPTNVSIQAKLHVELSTAYIAFYEELAADWIEEHDSDAEWIAPVSYLYNCHAYAWHVKDGGNKVWLNAHNDHDDEPEILNKYWTGSVPTYVLTTAQKATVAYYGSCWKYTDDDGWVNSCDHSAEVISTNLFESKWGLWPRYRHSPSDCPYTSTNIKYYKVPVTGDGPVCTSKTFSTLNIQGATYNWSGTYLTISGSGSSVTATKIVAGVGMIQADIFSPYSGTTVFAGKDIIVGTPTCGIEAIRYMGGPQCVYDNVSNPNENFFVITDLYGTTSTLEIENYYGANVYFPYSPVPVQTVTTSLFGITNSPSNNQDYLSINVRVNEVCGWSNWKQIDLDICPGYMYLNISPNPTTSFAKIQIASPSSNDFDINSNWDLEIHDQNLILKSSHINIRSSEFTINTSEWINGIYFVKARYKNKVLTGKLIVRH